MTGTAGMTTLDLPTTVDELFHRAIEPAYGLLPSAMSSPAANVMLLSIAQQESALRHRWQVIDAARSNVKGAARGLFQFEQGGGCAGVLRHAASRYWMHAVCKVRGCEPTPKALWLAIENDDVLAAAAARLLLFTDAKRLPTIGDEDGAWALYVRTWRPGAVERDRKNLRDKWAGNYTRAANAVQEVIA